MSNINGHKLSATYDRSVDVAIDDLLLGVPRDRQLNLLVGVVAAVVTRMGALIGERATLEVWDQFGPALRKQISRRAQ